MLPGRRRHLTSGGTFVLEAFVPDVCRFDLMARTAGMRPWERLVDWDRPGPQSGSQKHVSVWEPER